jgi:DNA-binding Xre family transcriptional regulator
MQRVDVTSFQALSKKAGVSEKQLRRLRKGEIGQLRMETLLKLSQALQVSISELLATFFISNYGIPSTRYPILSSIKARVSKATTTTGNSTGNFKTRVSKV